MKIMVDMGHPAHVHFFRHCMREMEGEGHQFLVTARDKDVTLQLLRAYSIDHTVVGKMGEGKLGLAREWLGRERDLYAIAGNIKPDVLTGIHNFCMAHISKLMKARSVIFTDTEHAKLANMLTFPFADVICTPSCFNKDLGKKQVRYNGYHELAYLSPDYFIPNPSVLEEVGLKADDKFVLLRFVSWGAAHDINQHGLSLEGKRQLIKELEKYARVFITSEGSLPDEFSRYSVDIPPQKFHDILYYAELCVSEGGTTATEAAVLGVPSIHISTTASLCGNFTELNERYGLIMSFSDEKEVVAHATGLLAKGNAKEEWRQKKEKMLAEKINVTNFITDTIKTQYNLLLRKEGLK